MDEIRKSTIRLSHWIDHNVDHLKGYREVAEVLEKQGPREAADAIRRGIDLIEQANAEFERGLTILSSLGAGAVEDDGVSTEKHGHERNEKGSHHHHSHE